MTAAMLAIFFILLSFAYQTRVPFEVLLYSQCYTSLGVLITVVFAIRKIERDAKQAGRETLMDGIFAHGTQSILLMDENGLIKLVNPFAQKIFGFDDAEMQGKYLGDLTPELKLNELSKLARAENGLRVDSIAKRRDGTIFPVEVTVNMYASRGIYYLVVFVIDITHRKEQEEALKSQKRSLEEVNSELETFSYSVSHDLRAPLRAVGGYAKMLEEDYNDVLDQKGKRLITVIQESASKMGLLIDELLQFSRLGRKELTKTVVDMKAIAETALYELNKSVQHSAEITIQTFHPALADASLMSHVWANLLSNAIKYSSKTESPRIEIKSEERDGKIIYSIKDNGVGFDMQYSHKLFGVFQRLHTSDEFEGTGVGLATAQRIIEKHGGKIWADGKVGVGATFYFFLEA